MKRFFYFIALLVAIAFTSCSNEANDLSTLSNENLLKRLYVIDRFENPSTVFLHRHNIVDTTRGKAPKFEDLKPNIRCSLSTIGFLILGRDFEIKGNKIEFNN